MFLASVLTVLCGLWSSVLWQVQAQWGFQLGAAAIFFFGSWLHVRDWLEDRWTWQAWGRLILAFVLPMVAMVLTLEALRYSVCQTIRDIVIPKN